MDKTTKEEQRIEAIKKELLNVIILNNKGDQIDRVMTRHKNKVSSKEYENSSYIQQCRKQRDKYYSKASFLIVKILTMQKK